jgi:PmbA protein
VGRERDLLKELLRRAETAGARRSDAYSAAGTGRTIEYSEHGLESYRGSTFRGVGVRVFCGKRAGFACGQDLTAAGLDRLARRAVESARLADLPSYPIPRGRSLDHALGILDVGGLAVPAAEDRDGLEAVVAQARAANPAVRRIKTVSLRSGRRDSLLLSSTGTEAGFSRSLFALGAGVVAEREGQSEMGWETDVATSRSSLGWGWVGGAAAEKAAARLGAGRPRAGRQPVILDREVVAEFLSLLGSTLSADAVLKGKSLYAGKLGTAQASPAVTVVDDPTLQGSVGSAPCDDEGQPTRRKVLFDAGVLTGFLHSLQTAHRMGVEPTGNGFRRDFETLPLPRPGNLVLEPGEQSPEAWERDAGSIVLVDEILGSHTMNPVSGDFSVGAAGFTIERGHRLPFRGATIAGNLGALFSAVAAVGSDLRFFGSVGAPSVLVRDLDLSA